MQSSLHPFGWVVGGGSGNYKMPLMETVTMMGQSLCRPFTRNLSDPSMYKEAERCQEHAGRKSDRRSCRLIKRPVHRWIWVKLPFNSCTSGSCAAQQSSSLFFSGMGQPYAKLILEKHPLHWVIKEISPLKQDRWLKWFCTISQVRITDKCRGCLIWLQYNNRYLPD